jgi:DNA adenine methylase
MGGKDKIGRALTAAIVENVLMVRDVVEPFVGWGGVAEHLAPLAETYKAADAKPDLILMWEALQAGWVPPDAVTPAEYAELKKAPPSALRGFVGFGLSFGGKWFGGYSRDSDGLRDYCSEARRAVLRKADRMRFADITCCDFGAIEVNPGDIVYCDPPYDKTTGYTTGPWDAERFWRQVSAWSQIAWVFVSEYQAPGGRIVWEREKQMSLDVANKSTKRLERLYLFDRWEYAA